MTMKAIVLVPTYNEKDNIVSLLRQILKVEPDIHILNIDDNSPDGTGKIVEEFSRDCPNIHIIHRPAKQGLGSAYIAGFDYALREDFGYILTMDADFSHSPAVIPCLIQEMKNYELVLGSRYIEGGRTADWGFFRRSLSKSANIFVQKLLHLGIKDYTTGFRCYNCEVLKKIKLEDIFSTGYAFQIEMVYKVCSAGGKIGEYPITFTERREGISKISSLEIIKAIQTVFRLVKTGE